MDQILAIKLARMGIGDSLIAPTGYAIDYVDPSGGTFHEPCYMLRLGTDRIFYMTKNEGDADRTAINDFLLDHPWADYGLKDPGNKWLLEPSGSEVNPVWEYPIGQITIPNHDWMFSPSPHTGDLKTQDWVQVQNNHQPVYAGGRVVGVQTRFYHSGKVQWNETHRIGRVYAVVKKSNAKSASPPLGFIQLRSIQQRIISSISARDLNLLGLNNFEQMHLLLRNFKYQPHRAFWVFQYSVVWTNEAPICRPAAVADTVADNPLQSDFLVAV